MSMKRNNKEKDTKRMNDDECKTSINSTFFDFCKKLYEEEFAKFSAIVAVFFSAGIWIVKTFWYAFISGRYSVYNIDISYFNVDNENMIFEIIKLSAILVVWFASNFFCYQISNKQYDFKFAWNKICKIILFWLSETLFLFWVVCTMSNTDLVYIIKNFYEMWDDVLQTLGACFICCIIINIFALEFLLDNIIQKRKRKKKEKVIQDNDIDNRKQIFSWEKIKVPFLIIMVTIALELIATSILSINSEYNRRNYKVVLLSEKSVASSEVEILYEGNVYGVYPIIFEDKDCFIVTRLYKSNGEIKIDYNYQRIIDKVGREVLIIQDIYKIICK